MKLFRHDDSEGPPCRHMEGLLNLAADGSSRGLVRWYTIAHAARCSRCGRFLESVKQSIHRLKATRSEEPNPETLKRLMTKASQAASQLAEQEAIQP